MKKYEEGCDLSKTIGKYVMQRGWQHVYDGDVRGPIIRVGKDRVYYKNSEKSIEWYILNENLLFVELTKEEASDVLRLKNNRNHTITQAHRDFTAGMKEILNAE